MQRVTRQREFDVSRRRFHWLQAQAGQLVRNRYVQVADGEDLHPWLCLEPGNKISGGKVLSPRTGRSKSPTNVLLRVAAVNVGNTDSALGTFYRRLAARVGKAVTAIARKRAILFYNALRYGMDYCDLGASYH